MLQSEQGVAPAKKAAGAKPTSQLMSFFGEAPDRVLIVDERGAYLGKTGERLRVSLNKQTIREVPLFDTEHVLLAAEGISISTDAIGACAEAGIPIDVISSRGELRACLAAAGLGATVRTRREQLRAYDDVRGGDLARSFAVAKLTNQARLLRYMAKYRKDLQPDLYTEVGVAAGAVEFEMRSIRALRGPTIDSLRQTILTHEGRGAARYWGTIGKLLPDEAFEGREGRGASDPVNSALNYGYTILFSMVQRAILLAGLDPFGGFMHVDRPGKPSLVLDMVEEFRQPVVDRCLFALINQGSTLEAADDGMLTLASRREIIRRIEDRLETPDRYDGKRYALRIIMQMQARRLASYLRGDAEAYCGFTARFG